MQQRGESEGTPGTLGEAGKKERQKFKKNHTHGIFENHISVILPRGACQKPCSWETESKSERGEACALVLGVFSQLPEASAVGGGGGCFL